MTEKPLHRPAARRTQLKDLVASIDIGSTKICCLIAKPFMDHDRINLEILGVGQQASKGIKSGTIIDLDQATHAIGAAVAQAEKIAGKTLKDVVVNISAGQIQSKTLSAEVNIQSGQINSQDIKRAMLHGRKLAMSDECEPIHAIPVTYSIDGNKGIRDPRGMFADILGLDLHLVTANSAAVRNLASCVYKNHLDITNFVSSPYASGLSTLVEDEKDLGCVLIDIGGGTTSFAVFHDGNMVYTDSISVGGNHVTNDIAQGLTISIADAERLKTLYGTALQEASGDRDFIDITPVGEDIKISKQQISRSDLLRIMRPRLEEIFEMVQEKLVASRFNKLAGRRAILTGGTAQTPNIDDLAQQILGRQTRIAKPLEVKNLPRDCKGPNFSTAIGLLHYASRAQADVPSYFYQTDGASNVVRKVSNWIKENF